MNYTTFINALSRELDKELAKIPDSTANDQTMKSKMRNAFDKAATTTLTREMDKLTKLGRPKTI